MQDLELTPQEIYTVNNAIISKPFATYDTIAIINYLQHLLQISLPNTVNELTKQCLLQEFISRN